MGRYFSKFPAISYDGVMAKNILTRAKVTQSAKDGRTTFYNFEVPEEKRVDVISTEYYDDPDYAWLIWLANETVDPYHDYYISDNNFKLFLVKKYGSLNAAYNTVHSWVPNWDSDHRELNIVQYESLPGYLKKYWIGLVTNAYIAPTKFVRARTDLSVITNRMAVVTDANAFTFSPGDEYHGLSENGDEYAAIVDRISGNTVSLKHIIGSISSSEYVKLQNSIVEVASIPAAEAAYWVPLSAFDHESKKNHDNRSISLIDKQMAFQVEKDLKKVLNQ